MLLLARTHTQRSGKKKDRRIKLIHSRYAGSKKNITNPAHRYNDQSFNNGGVFENAEIPVENLIGEEGNGFKTSPQRDER